MLRLTFARFDLYKIEMKTTYSVTQAQRELPSLLKAVNEDAATYGIAVHDDVKAYLVSKERMDSILETLELLSNQDAVAALKAYESGEMEFHDLDSI